MIEQWRDVVGFEGLYRVSSEGRVRNARTGLTLKPGTGPSGYPTVALGRRNTRTLHSLVADAFLGKTPEGQEVCHRDGDRQNPKLSNLRFGTRSSNNLDTFDHGMRKVDRADVLDIKARLARRETGCSIAELYGISQSMVSAIKHGRHYERVTSDA